MILNYISNDEIIYVDNYDNLDIKINLFNNIKFRTYNSNYLNFQTQIGINTDNKIISSTNKQLSYLIQKWHHFLGDDYAIQLKNNFETLKNTNLDDFTIIEEQVFQFFDYESVSSTGHSFDLMFYLLYYYNNLNLGCKLLVVESNNKYYNSLLNLIKTYYNIEFLYIKEHTSYLFKKFMCIKTYQNVLFNHVKTFINDTLITNIINKYDKENIKYFDNVIKIKYNNNNTNLTNRFNQTFNKTDKLDLFIEKNKYFDLNNIDYNEELKIYYLNKSKNIIIDWGSSYYININYYLLNTNNKFINIIFHTNIMGERNFLINDNLIVKQQLPDVFYTGVSEDCNIFSNFTFTGKIIDNISDINELLVKI